MWAGIICSFWVFGRVGRCMPKIDRPVEETGQGNMTIPVPGDVVKIVIMDKGHCYYEQGKEFHLIVITVDRLPGKRCEFVTQSPRMYSSCERFLLNVGTGKWYTGISPGVVECSLEIYHHVRVLNVPQGDPVEVIVEW